MKIETFENNRAVKWFAVATLLALVVSAPAHAQVRQGQTWIECNGSNVESGARIERVPGSRTIHFSRLSAEVGGDTGAINSGSRCNVRIPVEVPDGYQVAFVSPEFQGSYDLGRGVQGQFTAEYFFRRGPGGWIVRSPMQLESGQGNIALRITTAEERNSGLGMRTLLWAGCGQSVVAHIRAELNLQAEKESPRSSASINLAQFTAHGGAMIVARRCRQ